MGSEQSATAQLIDLIYGKQFEDLPEQVVHDTKRLITDTVGCALGARQYEAAQTVASVAGELGGPGEGGAASVVGTDLQVSPAAATSANMYLGNYLDADDTYLNFSHPGVAAVFSGLALAESLNLTGRELVAAVALGYEVGCRVGGALEFVRRSESGEIAMVSGNLGWYGFCVAAAAGKAMGLDPAQYNNAFGLAGWTTPIQTGPFFAPITRPGKHMLKYMPVGFQGLSGIVAAQLAARGFAAEQDIFDASEEFWVAFGVLGLNRERMLAGLGETWQVSRTSFKPYSACRHGHPAVTLCNELVQRHHLQPNEIEEVVVGTFESAVDWLGVHYPPQTPSDMQFSIPRAVAASAYGSDLGPSWQNAENIADERQQTFAQKVHVEGNPAAMPLIAEQMLTDGRFLRIPNEVRITARGQVFADSSEYTWGDPWSELTRMTDEQLADKFRRYAGAALPAAQYEEALDTMLELDQIKDVPTELAPLLRAG